jgi:hypothetical protein
MIIIITILALIALFGLLNIAALKWGYNSRRSEWVGGGYDPYEDWHGSR